VKPQTSAYLDKARELLGDAEAMLRIDRNEAAGRTAYLAGYHAAQALIFETSARIYKSHAGLQGEFARLVKDDPPTPFPSWATWIIGLAERERGQISCARGSPSSSSDGAAPSCRGSYPDGGPMFLIRSNFCLNSVI
jgi:hypothetical protein